MDVTPYVEGLRRDLVAAAAAGGDETRPVAERLGHAMDAAARLAIMEAVSQAAAEITSELPTGSVDVRLDGRELAFVVDAAPTPPPPPAPLSPPPAPEEEQGTARLTLRLPETLKTRVEDAASAAGQSLNTWLVGAVRRATGHAGELDVDLSSRPLSMEPFPGRGASRRVTGWI